MDDLKGFVDEEAKSLPTPSPMADRIMEEAKSANGPVMEPGPDSEPNSEPEPSTVFDPSIHCANPNGTPRLNLDGSFRKRPGRKIGGPSPSSSPHPVDAGIDPQVMAAAQMATGLLFMLGRVIGGDEWEPVVDLKAGIHEPKMLTDAFVKYFTVAGIIQLPPWAELALVVGSYAAARLQKPKTQTRVRRFLEWAKAKITRKPVASVEVVE